MLGYVLLLYYGDVWPKRCAAPHHTAHTPNTLFQTPSAAFSFHLSNSYSSLPFSSLSVPPSLTLAYLFTHPYISLPYCIHHFAWTLWAFLWLCFPQKEHNIADNLLWMMHILCIITPHSGCTHARRGFTVRSRVSDINAQFKQDQSAEGVHHICSLCGGFSGSEVTTRSISAIWLYDNQWKTKRE